MPSNSQLPATQQQWHDVAQSILFIWQFIVASYGIFIASTILMYAQCCYEQPPKIGEPDPWLLVFLVASFCMICAIVVEAHMFIADKLSNNVRLGFEVIKNGYAVGVFVWLIIWDVGVKKGHSGAMGLWWWITWRTVVYAGPFLIALAYAIYMKVKSTRRRAEEEPLLGHVE